MTRLFFKRMGQACAWGAAAGFVCFLAESVLILRSNAVGLNVDTRGPFAALLASVRFVLPGLLARVLATYLLSGAVVGLGAGALAGGSALSRRPRAHAVLFAADLVALWGLLVWARAIARPALFDDLPFGQGLLEQLATRGEPWHPRAAAAALLGAHALALLPRLKGRTLRVLAAGAVTAVLLPGAVWLIKRPPLSHAGPPLVVLIGIDAFRPDRVENARQEPVAPHLERFLQDATRFTHAYTPIAQTEPAWRSLLTARWPWQTGVRYPLTAPDRRVPLPTFPERFQSAGYHTTFATDCSRFNFQGPESGFQTLLEPPQGAVNFLLEKLRYRVLGLVADNALGARFIPEFVDNRALAGIHNPLAYARRLARTMAEESRSGPTLFAYHATAAHFPGDPVYPFYRKYMDTSEPLSRRVRMFFSPLSPGSRGGWKRGGAEALYDELLSQADAQLGVLLDRLKREGRYDEALIVVFSDHGEDFYEDLPELAGATPVHGARLTEQENRILLAVKLPKSQGALAPREVPDLVRLIDLGPTLLAAMGVPALGGVDGVSLLPLLRKEPMPPLRLYAETGYTHATPDVFDPGHFSGGARGFDAYRIRPDGVVEMNDAAHSVAMGEKDIGAFDGQGWLIRSPRSDGSVSAVCHGSCSPELSEWLDAVREPERSGMKGVGP